MKGKEEGWESRERQKETESYLPFLKGFLTLKKKICHKYVILYDTTTSEFSENGETPELLSKFVQIISIFHIYW